MSISPKGQLDFLLADTYHHETSWRWGTVTSVRPLSVRLDGDTGSNRIYPIDLTGGRFPNGSRILVALYGTQAYAIGPLPPDVGEWQNLGGFGGWTPSRAVWRYRAGGIDVVYRGNHDGSTTNNHRPFYIPGVTLNEACRGLPFMTTSLSSEFNPSATFTIDTNGHGVFYRHEQVGGWVDVNIFVPDYFLA